MKALSFAAAFLLCSFFAHAELQWEKKQLEFHPATTDAEVKAEFNFTNPGPDSVTIESVVPQCDCTVAALDRKIYQAGEAGRIAAIFTIGQRTGLQDKTIRVKIQGEKEITILSVVTHIPAPVKISPSLVFWRTGETPEPKTIELTLAPDAMARVTKVTSSDPKMTAKFETVLESKSYKVTVAPEDTTTPLAAILWIECSSPTGVPKSFTAYAHIKASSPSPTVGTR